MSYNDFIIIHMPFTRWSEPAATNAPVEDEVIEVVLGMNQKHILPFQNYWFFPAFSMPQKFSLLPTSPLLFTSPPSYLPPDFVLTPSPKLGSC
jgi:hypothetical protein